MCVCVFGKINKFSERKLNCFKLVSTWSGKMIGSHFHDRLLFIRHRKGSYQSRRSAWCCASSIDASWSSSHQTRRRECRSAWGTSSCQRTEKSAKDQRITISWQWEASFKWVQWPSLWSVHNQGEISMNFQGLSLKFSFKFWWLSRLRSLWSIKVRNNQVGHCKERSPIRYLTYIDHNRTHLLIGIIYSL